MGRIIKTKHKFQFQLTLQGPCAPFSSRSRKNNYIFIISSSIKGFILVWMYVMDHISLIIISICKLFFQKWFYDQIIEYKSDLQSDYNENKKKNKIAYIK